MFEVGKKAIVIDDRYCEGTVKNGDIFTVVLIEECKCGIAVGFDLSRPTHKGALICIDCGQTFNIHLNIRLFDENEVAPLDDWKEAESFVEQVKITILEPELI